MESKYVKYIKKGYFVKLEIPKKEDFNFNSINSLELFKNNLKNYLEVLTNEPNMKININDSTLSSKIIERQLKNQTQNPQGNFLPRELLEFLNFDVKLIADIMELQEQQLNQAQHVGMTDSVLYGEDVDRALIKRTGSSLEDVRAFLRKLLLQERFYSCKVDCIQKNTGTVAYGMNSFDIEDNVIFTFQINKKFYFSKTLKELDLFCRQYSTSIKNPFVKGIGELF